MKIYVIAFHVINSHVPVCHAFESSCKWVIRLFRHVNEMSLKCFVMYTEVAPTFMPMLGPLADYLPY